VFQIEAAIERSTVQTPADWTRKHSDLRRQTTENRVGSTSKDWETYPLGRTSGIFYCDQSN